MQNERLFRKIKQTTEHSAAASGDWDPERVWAKVEQRQKRHKVSLWLPYAAASAVLILGLAVWLSLGYQENMLVQHNESSLTATSGKTPPIQDLTLLQGPTSDASERKDLIIKQDKQSKTSRKILRKTHLVNSNKKANGEDNNVNGSESDSPHVLAGGGTLEQESALESAIPDQPYDNLTPLLQMFEHAKRVREERKMIVRLEEKNRAMDLMFFDHPAFMDHHPGNEPKLFLQKR
jgi:hypothetical protein